ncbi:MAG: Fe-S cluster assembly protein SufD [Acidimicrobiia bacterium]
MTATAPPGADLAGPDWLRARRALAAERLVDLPLPTTDEEVWRYSRIGELDPSAFAPVPAQVEVDVPDGAGIRVGPAGEVPGGAELVRSVAGEPTSAVGWLHDLACSEPLVVDVPAGVVVGAPIVVRVAGPPDGAATAPHLVVRAGPASQVQVVLRHAGGGRGLELPLTELRAGSGARLDLVAVQDLDERAWTVGSLVAEAADQSEVRVGLAAFGGDYARVRTDCRLAGRGASGQLLAAYFGEGDQTLDFRTFQDHAAPDTTSDLLFKGALGGRARSVYTGLIRVEKEARGTNAFQTNRNLKLSDEAWAESVPNLEIENNDVRCSHASTVGPVDADHRFYLESRGIPTPVAERLVVTGFFDEVLARMPVPDVVGDLRARVAAKLDQGAR